MNKIALYSALVFMVLYLCYWWFCINRCASKWQKTRDPQQRRIYVGSRVRPSLGQQAPTIYVSPSNLPPPPKYEAMAPPSYEEVVGIHYPNYQPSMSQTIAAQPITQPIVAAVAQQNSQANDTTSQATSRQTDVEATTSTVTITIPPTTSVSQ